MALPSGSDVLALDITEGVVRLLWGKESAAKVTFQKIVEKTFSEDAEPEMGKFIADTLRDLKIRKHSALCVVPAKQFITKNIDIPSNDQDEIGKIVDLQAGRLTPYSREEIVIDYLSMEVKGQYYTNVLLAIINRKLAEKYCRIFEMAGLEMERLVIASEGLAVVYDEMVDRSSQREGVAGIQINEDSSELTVLDRRQMVFIRVIPVGHKQFQENREAAQSEFMVELNKSIVAYQNLGVGRPIKHLILTGRIAELDYLEQALRDSVPYVFASNLPIKTTAYENFFEASEEVKEFLAKATQGTYFDLLASLYARKELKIDAVPREMKMKRRLRDNARQLFALSLWVVAVTALFISFLGMKHQFRHVHIDKLNRLQSASFEDARKLSVLSDKTRLFRNIIDERGRGLRAFEKISSFIGSDISLTSLSYDRQKSFIKFSGTADSMSRIFAFVTELEESNYFQSIKTNKTKSRREGTADVADFELEGILAEGF